MTPKYPEHRSTSVVRVFGSETPLAAAFSSPEALSYKGCGLSRGRDVSVKGLVARPLPLILA